MSPLNAARRDPIEFLLQYCAPDALVDSKERYDAPRCSPETRDKIQEEIIHWINSPDGLSAVFWLFGSAGAGKSAVCQTIAEVFKREGLLLGNFFFSRGAGSAGRSNGDRLIPTLIYQLSQALPETRSFIKKVIRQNPLIMDAQRATQMSDLYVASLNRSPVRNFFRRLNWGKRVRLVVIDGWDECQNPEVQCDLLRIIAGSAKALRLPVRFLITSRPESHIEHTFLHDLSFRGVRLSKMNLDADLDAYQSICAFLHAEFRSVRETHPLRQSLPPSWPSEADVLFLASKSSPQFVYAATVMRYVGDPYADEPPDIRLDTILTISNPTSNFEEYNHPLEHIDKLYRFIFEQVKPHHRKQVWCLLGILHLASKEQFQVPDTSPEFFGRLFNQKPGHLYPILRPLASVLDVPHEESRPIQSLHASLFDFLLDPRRSGNLSLDLQQSFGCLFGFHLHSIITSGLIDPPITTIIAIMIQVLNYGEGLETVANELSRFEEFLISRNDIESSLRVIMIDHIYTKISNALDHKSEVKLFKDRYAFYQRKKRSHGLIKNTQNPFISDICSLKHYICLDIIATQTSSLKGMNVAILKYTPHRSYLDLFNASYITSAALHYYAAIIALDLGGANPAFSARIRGDMNIIYSFGEGLQHPFWFKSGGELILGSRKLVLQYFDPRVDPECDVFKLWSDIPVAKLPSISTYKEYTFWSDDVGSSCKAIALFPMTDHHASSATTSAHHHQLLPTPM